MNDQSEQSSTAPAGAASRAGEAGANLTGLLESALILIKDSLPPHERDTGFQEFHISFGNGIMLRDANGTMICAGYNRIADAIVAMRSNVEVSGCPPQGTNKE